jgi:hypothetical protein
MTARSESRPYAVVDHPWADNYLARRREWDWHSPDEIDVFAPDGSSVEAVLRDWQTPIFHVADGNHTLQEFVSTMADQYRDPAAVPADLNRMLLEQTRSLVEDLGVIELWDAPADLADEYDLPRTKRQELGIGQPPAAD